MSQIPAFAPTMNIGTNSCSIMNKFPYHLQVPFNKRKIKNKCIPKRSSHPKKKRLRMFYKQPKNQQKRRIKKCSNYSICLKFSKRRKRMRFGRLHKQNRRSRVLLFSTKLSKLISQKLLYQHQHNNQ